MRTFFQYTSYLIPLKLSIQQLGEKSIFPFYHLVSDSQPAHAKHLYRIIDTKGFKRDLEFLLKYFEPIDPKDLLLASKANKKKSGFLLSFDDGFREVKEVIAPILLQKGIPAVFFVNPAYIDNLGLMYRCKISLLIEKVTSTNISGELLNRISNLLGCSSTVKSISNKLIGLNNKEESLIDQIASKLEIDFEQYLQKERPYLSTDNLFDLSKSGFIVGAHGYNHPYFSTISYKEQVDEVVKSMDWIKTRFVNQPKLFAFPFTDYGVSDDVVRMITQQPNAICDLTFGSAGIQPTKYSTHIQRIPMEKINISGKHIVSGEILYYLAKKATGYYKKYDKNI